MERIILFAATEKGYVVCKKLIDNKIDTLGCVITFKETLVEKDWSNEIVVLCKKNNIKVFYWNDIKNELYSLLSSEGITSAFAISWRYYISLDINKYLKNKLVIFHDSLLPQYRGFAPTPTAIINGERVIGITALYASESIDCGEIILQKEINISDDLYMRDIIKLQSEVYADMLFDIINRIEKMNIESYTQDESKASYSIWRDLEDCHINWSQDAKQIYNFVRALSYPYKGAYTYWGDKKIIIDRAEILDHDYNFVIRDYGKVWKIENGNPIIICKKGMLKVISARYENNESVHFNRIRIRFT